MKPNCIVLRFGQEEIEPGIVCLLATALDEESGLPVARLTLPMMAAWLKRNGYAWRFGSSGIYDRRRAA